MEQWNCCVTLTKNNTFQIPNIEEAVPKQFREYKLLAQSNQPVMNTSIKNL